MKEGNSVWLNLIDTWINRRQQKKSIAKIEQNNTFNRGIISYEPDSILNFFNPDEYIGNYIISGGTNFYRNQVLSACSLLSITRSIPVVILHNHNTDLINQIKKDFNNWKGIINIQKSDYYYDPIFTEDQSFQEIFLQNLFEKNSYNTGYYIRALLTYLNAKNIKPSLRMLIFCPHNKIGEKVRDALINGKINQNQAANIQNMLKLGQKEKGIVEFTLNKIYQEGKEIIPDRSNLNRSFSINKAFQNNFLILIDISSGQDELLKLILNDYKYASQVVSESLLIIDNLSVFPESPLEKVIKNSNGKNKVACSGDDVYSLLNGNQDLFQKLTGNSSKIFIFNHLSGISAQKFSELFGQYDEQYITESIEANHTFRRNYEFMGGKSLNVTTRREFSLRPENIMQLQNNQLYLLDKNSNQKIFTSII